MGRRGDRKINIEHYILIICDVKNKGKIIRFYILTFIIIAFFLSIVHESGHIIFCCLVGGKTLLTGVKDEMLGILYVENQYPNQFARGIGALGGSLFDCIVILIILCLIKFTEKGEKMKLALFLTLWVESCYWIISILLGFGDAWNYSQALGISSLSILIICLIICVVTYGLSIKAAFKILREIEEM